MSLIRPAFAIVPSLHAGVLVRCGAFAATRAGRSYASLAASPRRADQHKGKPALDATHTAHKAPPHAITTTDAVSTLPGKTTGTVDGDWVLFHPVYTEEELKSVEVLHHKATKFSDKLAYGLVKFCRLGFDIISGYKHKPMPEHYKSMSVQDLRKGGYILTPDGWLNRILFLESIAGVPGMVAATVRHLHSLRLLRRDSGWIHTLLEEAENERMHLMTFMQLRKHGIFFRGLLLGAQGVFYNMFFLCYLVSPSACHRFVGYLEEEAVITYSRCIKDMEDGLVPEWTKRPAPPISIDYWRLAPDATMLDVIYAVRADESTHRFVNHSFGNLQNKIDVNPFALREPDMTVKGTKAGFDREEAAEFVQESREKLYGQRK
ncbi:alternative oxidase [Fistulina hepatica ATCC 64428]|uniref:Alternative oxidase n=1 Tax=Fistulina hepatica ATCC 64428 TaxID=1128425 RepID=A0A0D7AGC6_9AGAR|nr:alternative oxidase [Fistulina hepatica ATCC 64428]